MSWYEFAKDFSGPIATIIVVPFSVWFAFGQIRKQHDNTIKAQKAAAKRDTKVELFKELSKALNEHGEPIGQTATFCTVKKYSSPNQKAEITHAEFQGFFEMFGKPLLSLILQVEAQQIIHQKLFKTFRFALSSIHNDFMALQFSQDRTQILEQMIQLTDDAQMYMSDFQICLQNIAYGDVFDDIVPARIPADKRIKVITSDDAELDELLEYFSTQTAWGKKNLQLEKEAQERFTETNKKLENPV